MMYARGKRPVVYRQKGGYYYQNGLTPNQQGGDYYQNGLTPNQQGGDYYQNGLNPNQQGGFVGQFGGARTKGSLRRQYAADALLRLSGATPGVKGVKRRRGTGGKRKRRAADNQNLLMVNQFKAANPDVRVNDLHALASGWKLHGTNLGEERKGYGPACMRMGALLGAKMYSSPTSPWMTKMKNGEPLDLVEECDKLRRNPMATSTNVHAPATVADVVNKVVDKAVRKSSRPRKRPVKFGFEQSDSGRNQKGGFLPLLALAAPALAKLVL